MKETDPKLPKFNGIQDSFEWEHFGQGDPS